MTPKNKDIFLYILPIAFGLASYAWEQKYGALLLVPGLALAATCALVLLYKLSEHMLRAPDMAVFAGGTSTPSSLQPISVLRSLRQGHELTIVARTCKRWLAANEAESEATFNSLYDALHRGAKITLVLQDLRSSLHSFTPEEHELLEKHQQQALAGYRRLQERLDRATKSRLALLFRQRQVTQSMVVLFYNGGFVRLVQDISMGFEEKAFVVVRKQEKVNNLIGDLSQLVAEARSSDDHFLDRSRDLVEGLLAAHGHHLRSRNNSPRNLVRHAAARFLAESKGTKSVSPLTVQLSLTNRCKTVCRMCTHYQLAQMDPSEANHRPSSEMDSGEVCRVIGWTARLKTASLLLSGGEPLAYPGLREVIEEIQGTKRDGSPIKVGLLTSGVGKDGLAISAPLAKLLAESCQWIQVSIDSFNPKVYFDIRRKQLEIPLRTIRTLVENGFRSIQVCYTIQNDNVDEIIDGSVFEAHRELLPNSVELRFKFAHGHGADYLVDEERLRQAVKQISVRLKNPYLEQMMRDGYFTYEGVARGLPVDAVLDKYKMRKYTCRVIGSLLIVDSNGDVYPCCYLFDDNVAESPYRRNYRLGSLRDEAAGMVPDPASNAGNPFLTILADDNLAHLQDVTLPIEPHACGKCTRHAHQNEFLNELTRLFRQSEEDGIHLAENAHCEFPASDGVWI